MFLVYIVVDNDIDIYGKLSEEEIIASFLNSSVT